MADGDPDLLVSASPYDMDAGDVDAGDADGGNDDARNDDAGAEEVLESRRRELLGGRRTRLVALGVVVLLAVAVLAVHAASGSGSGRHSAASAVPTPSTAAPHPVVVPAAEPHDGLTIEVRDHIGRSRNQGQYVLPTIEQPPGCPDVDDGLSGCTGTRFVPAPLLSAVRALLPEARTSSSTTLVLRPIDAFTRDAVWSRRYEATGPNSTQLTVQIGTGDQTSRLGGQVVTYYEQTFVYSDHRVDGRTVQVLVIAAEGHAPALAAVRRLARDPRLLALL